MAESNMVRMKRLYGETLFSEDGEGFENYILSLSRPELMTFLNKAGCMCPPTDIEGSKMLERVFQCVCRADGVPQ